MNSAPTISHPTAPHLAVAAPSGSLSPRLVSRLDALGVTAIRAESHGQVTAANQPSWLIERIIDSPAFAALIVRRWDDLTQCLSNPAVNPQKADQPSPIEVCPGLFLQPLQTADHAASQKRRRVSTQPKSICAALLLSSAFVESQAFARVCDHARLDRLVTVNRLASSDLHHPSEIAQLARTLCWFADDAAEIERAQSELAGMTSELAESYEELSLLYKLSTSMGVTHWAGEFLTQACSELRQVLGLRWLNVQLVDDDPQLEDLAGQRFVDGEPSMTNSGLSNLGQALLRRYGKASGPMLINDLSEDGLDELPEMSEVHGKLLVAPLQREGRSFGVVFGAEKTTGSLLSSIDTNLVSTLGVSLTIFLENRVMYEDSQAMFLGTLHALTSAIDAKDSYTHGHSERVALLSRMLAEAAGLDGETVERVYLSGLVHDVGKIGVPEAVLTKPGRLTDPEFEQIKRHPEIGARILEDIRQMADLLPGVLHHHERWDGRGYPHKLGGCDIPLFGRLIGLADAFDAMSSDRTYRAKLSRLQVLEEVERCQGTQFDAELAAIFVKMDFSAYDALIDKHARTPTPMNRSTPRQAA